MAYADGSIQKVLGKDGRAKKNVWTVTVSLGVDSFTGKRRRVKKTVHGTYQDAKRVAAEIRADSSNGLRVGRDVTFGEFASRWVESRRSSGEYSPRTLADGESFAALFDSYIGMMKLKDVDAMTVSGLLDAIREDKRREDGTTVSTTTMRKHYTYLSMMLKQAADFGLIASNPCEKVKPPRVEKSTRNALSAADFTRLDKEVMKAEKGAYNALVSADTDVKSQRAISLMSKLCAVRLGMSTGMRLGEVLGLPWSAVDFESGRVTVAQSLTIYGGLKAPKSGSGSRVLAVDGGTMAMLQRLAAAQSMTLAGTVDGSAPVFCNGLGGWLSVANFERWFRSWRSQVGFESLRFHELRHTQATRLLAMGVDVKTVQKRMGHSNANITLNWYAHADAERDARAAVVIGGLFADKASTAAAV